MVGQDKKSHGSASRMVKRFRDSGWVMQKDLLELWRNKLALVMLVAMPFMMMAMFGYIFPSGDAIQDQPIAIVNLDGGNASATFVQSFETVNAQAGFFELTDAASYGEAKDLILQGDLSGAVIIYPGFSENVTAGRTGNVTAITDESNPQTSMQIRAALQQTVAIVNNMISAQRIGQMMPNATANGTAVNYTISSILSPYSVKSGRIVPGDPSYFDFMAPGIIAMTMMFAVMVGLPHAISYEKEVGTLDGIMVAPVSRFSIILGKVSSQSIRGFVQGSIIMSLAIVVYGVTVQGSIPLVVLLMFLGVFSFIGLGILMTSVAPDQETAQMLLMALQFPMMFLSGIFYPVSQMPEWVQLVAKFIPLTYAVQAMRKVIVLGAGIGDIWLEVAILFAFGSVMLAIAIPVFNRAMKR